MNCNSLRVFVLVVCTAQVETLGKYQLARFRKSMIKVETRATKNYYQKIYLLKIYVSFDNKTTWGHKTLLGNIFPSKKTSIENNILLFLL